eukprot:TCALIF_04411-PA protein Name:"Protein of unknown function" AED:0.02 eAED:0.02 QI:0/0.5/0.33/0.66/1/1/3/456/504
MVLDDGTRRWDGVPVPLERQCLDALLARISRTRSPFSEAVQRSLTDRQVQYLITHLKARPDIDRPTAFLIWRSLFSELSGETLDLAEFTDNQSLSHAIYEHITSLPLKSIQCRTLFLSDEVGSGLSRWHLKFQAFLKRFQSLHTITVSNDLIDGALGDIGQFCPALHKLRIYQASRVSHTLAMDDEDILDFVGYQTGNIHFQHLDLSSCQSGFSAESILSLHQLPNLITLDTLTDHFQTVETREIKPFNSLQTLNLRANQFVKACLSVIPQLCPDLLNLSLLRINGDSISSDNCQPQYTHYLPELRALGPRLKRCQVMLCSDVDFLAEQAPKLETLQLVDPKLKFSLKAGHFRQLNRLELFKHSFSLDFDIVRQILETCFHLTAALFYASEVKNITHDLVLKTFQSPKNQHIRRNLRSFRLASVHSLMRNLTWDTVIGIVTVCPKLEHLDDLSTWSVTRDGRGQKTGISGRTFHLVQDNHASNCDQSLTALLWMTENYRDILHP